MPIAAFLPAIIGAAGAGLSALGGAGKQGQEKGNTTGSSTDVSSKSGTQTSTPNEDPLFAKFRQQLLPLLMGQINKAGQPAYGDAEKAGFLNDQNKIANAGMESLKSKAGAAGGGLGGLAAGLTGLEANREGNATNFFSQIPFLNKQYADNRTSNLLGLATNFAGKAPVGSTTTQQETGTNTGTRSGTQNQSQYGPSFGSSLFNSLGGMFGQAAGGTGPFAGLFGQG
jgi:hypothetical protein